MQFQKVRQSYIPLEPILGGRRGESGEMAGNPGNRGQMSRLFVAVRTMEEFRVYLQRFSSWLILRRTFLLARSLLFIRNYKAILSASMQFVGKLNDSFEHASDTPLKCRSNHIRRELSERTQRPARKISNARDSDKSRTSNPKKDGGSWQTSPSEYEIQIYRVSLTGMKQNEIAATMKANTGIPCNQSKVSRAIKKVKCFLKRGNVLPDVSPRKSQKITVDPCQTWKRVLVLDGRKPQR